jgi:glycosyltransferase involved in cell wall biosynthesis
MGHPLLRSAQRVIVLSAQAREIYSESGVPESKLIVWPNFLPLDLDPGKAPANGGGARWLFVGRLSAEKGILRLLRAWPSHVPLMVIGDGEERASVEAAARGKDVEFMGPVTREAVVDAMRGSIGLVFPSECFESFPMVYAEAMGAGLPVLAWGPNVVAALVSEHGTGDSVTWKDDLPAVLARAGERFPELRDHCRAVFERDLSEDAYLRRAEALYEDVLINP